MIKYLIFIVLIISSCKYKYNDKILGDYFVNHSEIKDSISPNNYNDFLTDSMVIINSDHFNVKDFKLNNEILDTNKLEILDFNIIINGFHYKDSNKIDFNKYRKSIDVLNLKLKYFLIGKLMINNEITSVLILVKQSEYIKIEPKNTSDFLVLLNINKNGQLLSTIKLSEQRIHNDGLSYFNSNLYSKRNSNTFTLYYESNVEQLDMEPGAKKSINHKLKIELLNNGILKMKY